MHEELSVSTLPGHFRFGRLVRLSVGVGLHLDAKGEVTEDQGPTPRPMGEQLFGALTEGSRVQ